jgi:hypothetical protein
MVYDMTDILGYQFLWSLAMRVYAQGWDETVGDDGDSAYEIMDDCMALITGEWHHDFPSCWRSHHPVQVAA